MRPPQKFGEDSHRLPPLCEMDQMGVPAPGDARVRFVQEKHAHVETTGVEPANDFARVSHLRIRQPSVGETIDKNPNRCRCKRHRYRHPRVPALEKRALPDLIEGIASRVCPVYTQLT